MEKVYVAELMRITKWASGDITAHSLSYGSDDIDDVKRWILLTIYSDMNDGVYSRGMHLLDGGRIENVEAAEVGKWYPYAHSNERNKDMHARYTYSITERCI